jgi:lysyl-tRNA synthetase class 2
MSRDGEQTGPPPGELRAARMRKRDELAEAGHRPYGNTFRPEHDAARVRADCRDVDPPATPSMDPVIGRRYVLAGRIMVKRGFGKAAFMDLQDASGRIQLYVKKGIVDDAGLALVKKLGSGDIVGLEGYPFYTKTGELTVMVERLELVTKAVRPLAEKWHGLVDPEVRYRQRYLDLVMDPAVREIFSVRGLVLGKLREYLDAQRFVEVETPILHPIRGGANARPFRTHHNALDMDLYLRIAPELYLKRMLVGGFERVYEIGKVFRNEGVSTRHNPEFTELEFYEAYTDYLGVLDRAERMLAFVERAVHERFGHLRERRGWDLQAPFERLDMRDAIVRHGAGLGLTREILDDPPALRQLYRARVEEGERVDDAEIGRVIFDLFERLVEPELRAGPVAVLHFPTVVSPLSRPSDEDPAWTDRFEVYLEGREIINAFSELNDPQIQAQRFREQVAARAGGDDEAMDFDADYIRALEVGMPPAGGFGLGIDRLVMALCGVDSIREVILFPLLRPEAP